MSKHNMSLTLVEMYACKHALQKQIPMKRLQLTMARFGGVKENVECLEKDINHEIALISRFEREIREYREAKRINY